MSLHTTLNNADVTVTYNIEIDEVDCYDKAANREYIDLVLRCVLESVIFKGVDILDAVSDADKTMLEMECEAHYKEDAALASEDI